MINFPNTCRPIGELERERFEPELKLGPVALNQFLGGLGTFHGQESSIRFTPMLSGSGLIEAIAGVQRFDAFEVVLLNRG